MKRSPQAKQIMRTRRGEALTREDLPGLLHLLYELEIEGVGVEEEVMVE